MYVFVKLPLRDLDPETYPPYLTRTYTYGVTIMPIVFGGGVISYLFA